MKKYYIMNEDLMLRETKRFMSYRVGIVLSIALMIFIIPSALTPKEVMAPLIVNSVDTVYVSAHDTTPLTKDNLWLFINQCEIQFPDVVFQQFMGETNHLKSKSCLIANNLGGFKVEPSDRYEATYHIKGVKYLSHLVFPTWKHCVMHYKEFQKANFDKKPRNYYRFLKSQGYAESPLYINLLKSIDVPDSIKK